MQRILQKVRDALCKDTQALPCVVQFRKGNLRVEILQRQLPCGHCAYRVDVAFLADGDDCWIEIAAIRDFCLEETIDMLQEAKKCLDNLRSEQ